MQIQAPSPDTCNNTHISTLSENPLPSEHEQRNNLFARRASHTCNQDDRDPIGQREDQAEPVQLGRRVVVRVHVPLQAALLDSLNCFLFSNVEDAGRCLICLVNPSQRVSTFDLRCVAASYGLAWRSMSSCHVTLDAV